MEDNKTKSFWHDNLTQFARVIAELEKFGLTAEQKIHLCETMDLPEEKVFEIIERAEVENHRAKFFEDPKRETPHNDIVSWRLNAFGS